MNTFTAGPSGRKALKFHKMHGLGNDYVYLVQKENPGLESLSESQLSMLAREISHRHMGLGGDGMVVIAPSREATLKMRMWNADGSEAQMCGNASRCVGKLAFESGLVKEKEITLETLAGIKRLTLSADPQNPEIIDSVTVDMGTPTLSAADIPVIPSDMDAHPAYVDAFGKRFVAVSMGNPHAVCFVEEITDDLVLVQGPQMEVHPSFPEKSNIEYARIINRTNIQMRVWERGTGETMACGTGACATAVAAIMLSLTERKVNVHLPGGILKIDWDAASGHVFMQGPATHVAQGLYFPACI